ncbi:hypothetical protein [Nocardioides marmorisolisilvae]|uniref:Uncharacterized protein n=1 Tax=Nocardioides marmorisolisilvae TaxID=1542737 RepID=A0A3N0DRV2_9ACTN|nr:hypothetical protein [Nocardioides marmorisolisilvae]RNL78359.1 hypothetical protein EFL95_04445 [Nocardioides marmorisolisilvae]
MDHQGRHRDWALLKQNVASFVVGVLGILVFIATGSKVLLVITMVILFFLPPVSRFRAWRRNRK